MNHRTFIALFFFVFVIGAAFIASHRPLFTAQPIPPAVPNERIIQFVNDPATTTPAKEASPSKPASPQVAMKQPLSLFDAAILADMNAARKAQGLDPLTEDARLDRVAGDKVADLQHGPFDHGGTDGRPSWHWFTSEGYQYAYNGENLAKGFSDPKAAFAAYMASPEHRKNILNPLFKDVGLSSVQMPEGMMEAVEFGEPAS